MKNRDKKFAAELADRHCKNNSIKNPFTWWKIYMNYLKDIREYPEIYYTKKLDKEI